MRTFGPASDFPRLVARFIPIKVSQLRRYAGFDEGMLVGMETDMALPPLFHGQTNYP